VLFYGRFGGVGLVLGMRLVLGQARQMSAEIAGWQRVDDFHRVTRWRNDGAAKIGRQDI
jgi:hypothetical protein